MLFLEKIIHIIFGKKDKSTVSNITVCPWCQKIITEGSPVTLYGLYKATDIAILPENIKVIYEERTYLQEKVRLTKVVGCSNPKCWSNKDGAVIYGHLKNNTVVPLKNPPGEEKNKIFSFS